MSRFSIKKELGQGGMGIVYLALDKDLEREVAIKFLHTGQPTISETEVARFKREMSVLINLSHPNIIKVFDAGEKDGRLFYVMEYLDAKDLLALAAEKGRFEAAQMLAVADQILDALDYIHGKGLVHRDIKPANIMVDTAGRAVLMDFGLVRQADASAVLTAEGKIVGTPRYLPPELIRGQQAEAQADFWCLGVSMYELLAGQRPFPAETLKELALQIVRLPHRPLSELRSDLPAGVAEFVDRCLAKEPADRWANAAQARKALAAIGGFVNPLAGPKPGGWPVRRTTQTRRSTGRSSGTATRIAVVPGSSGQNQAFWLALAVLVAALALTAWRMLAITVAAPQPVPVTVSVAPSGIVARYTAAYRLSLAFEAPSSFSWTVVVDGATAAREVGKVGSHKLEFDLPSRRPPAVIELVSAGKDERTRVPVPVHPYDLTQRIVEAIRVVGLDDKATDQLWVRIRRPDSARGWPGIPGWTILRGGRSSPDIAVEAANADPKLVQPLMDFCDRVRKTGDLGASYVELKPMLATLLADPVTPESVRSELLHIVWRLDLVDSLCDYFGRPSPFGVRYAVSKVVTIECEPCSREMRGPPGSKALVAYDDGKGMLLFPAEDNLGDLPSGETILSATGEAGLKDHPVGAVLPLDVRAGQGATEKRFHVIASAVCRQDYLALQPPGAGDPLPVRLVGWNDYTPEQALWWRVIIRGPLAARPGAWRLLHRHIFADSGRPYFNVHAVSVEVVR